MILPYNKNDFLQIYTILYKAVFRQHFFKQTFYDHFIIIIDTY